MGEFCTKCGKTIIEGAKFCSFCGALVEQHPDFQNQQIPQSQAYPQPYPQTQYVAKPTQFQTSPHGGIWYQNFYRIRKKVVTVGNKYWIEDNNGSLLGFCKQKILKLKEDIRIYTDESLNHELFCIKQQQIMDAWGSFAVIDSFSGTILGYIKREWLSSSFAKDTWEIFNSSNQQIGKITEKSTGHALARKYLPGGALIPEKMTLEYNGVPIAEINQSFKIIGDIWEMTCHQVPQTFDRRVLLGTMLLMGTIERKHK